MTSFLLELRSEEIPARMQKAARAELEKLFRREMGTAGVEFGALTIWSTPRRLALIVRDLPLATSPVREEAKGPPVGAPDQAVEGFCRNNGIDRSDLEERDVKGRATWFAVKNIPGRATAEVLAAAIPAIIRDFSWPKSMRWGAASVNMESLRWVRPLSGIVALLGDDVVACSVDGIPSGAVTQGHRFHHSGAITIGNADDYAVKLRAAHVIVDHKEREAIVRDGAAKVAADAGLTLVADEGLVVENAGLTEWPVPLLGRFDAAFLDVPPEVIQLTARVNQKYFVCEDSAGKLANAFICTANIAAADGGAAIVDGNRKVLAARLSDARFFWEQDRKITLAEHAAKLERITFHEKLGTVADKVERVAKLARWLCEEGIVTDTPLPLAGGERDLATKEPSRSGVGASAPMPTPNPSRKREGNLADLAEQAARLCKADLVTEMVGEFPELQGLMGGYYARAEGLPVEVADAIRDHYKPVGQGDDVPSAPVTVAVSLADKLDTLVGFFSIDEKPTGSKDPFALRRAAIAIILTLQPDGIRLRLGRAVNKAASSYKLASELRGNEVIDFFADRLKVQQREAGVRHDLIDAVFALGGEDDLVRLLARVHALQAFIETENGTNLLAGYKRAANILKKENWDAAAQEPEHTGEEDPLSQVDDPDLAGIYAQSSYTPEPAEAALIAALDAAEPQADAAIEAEDFAAAMSALASLRAPIDAFFEAVTVNDENSAKRAARLALLARLRAAVHNVADFSRIEG